MAAMAVDAPAPEDRVGLQAGPVVDVRTNAGLRRDVLHSRGSGADLRSGLVRHL